MKLIKNSSKSITWNSNYYEPKTKEDLIKLLKLDNITFIGSKHTFSPSIKGKNTISLKHFNKIEKVSNNVYRVYAGVTMSSLYKYMRDNDLDIPTMGGSTHQTVVGAIITATHGSGIKQKALTEYENIENKTEENISAYDVRFVYYQDNK